MTTEPLRPELVLMNGDLRTMDPRRPRATALAAGDGRILAVGRDHEVRALAGPDTRIIDLQRRLTLPGFMDTHLHFYDWALGRKQLLLDDAVSLSDLLNRVQAAAAQTEPGNWVLGQGWNEVGWPEGRKPTRDDLDRVVSARPVVLWRCDLHLATANSAALEAAGIDEDTLDPPEGAIERDESDRPTGILRELAINLVKEVMQQPSDDEVASALRDGIDVFHSLGLTAAHDVRLMGGVEWLPAFRAWQRLREAGELRLRCWTSPPGEWVDEIVDMGLRTGFGDQNLRFGPLKYFADGGMGARTAWMLEPYLDAGCGMPLISVEDLEDAVRKADRAGLACIVHAIGDRANREVTGIYARILKERTAGGRFSSPAAPIPHRIEHVQMIQPKDLNRLAKLNIPVCVQPANMQDDFDLIDNALAERGRWCYAIGSMIKAGLNVCFSSDAPVCDLNPMAAIHAAVTRQRPDGYPDGGWYPEERLTVEEALRCYTINAATAYGLQNQQGSLTPGKRADFTVLERNLYEVPPPEIPEVKVYMTAFDGRIVYPG